MARIAFFAVGLLIGMIFLGSRFGLAGSSFSGAVEFVRHSSGETHMNAGHDLFLSIVGEKKPSDWVTFFLSSLSTSSWLTANSIEAEGAEQAVHTCPLAPDWDALAIISELDAGNKLTATKPAERYGSNSRLLWIEGVSKILVIIPDDENSRIRVRGYEDWKPVPAVDEAWDFPRLAPITERRPAPAGRRR